VAARLEAALPADGAARSARRLALTRARRPVAIGEPGSERPALSPPPLPSGLRTVTAPQAAPARPAAAPAQVKAPMAPPVAAAPPRAEGAAPARSPPAPPVSAAAQGPGRLFDPRLPLLVGAAMAAVGLLIGTWLGR